MTSSGLMGHLARVQTLPLPLSLDAHRTDSLPLLMFFFFKLIIKTCTDLLVGGTVVKVISVQILA